MEADLAEFAHINLDDVWLGRVSVRHALVCVEQQFENPRARLFVAVRGGDTRFRDITDAAFVGMDLFDLIASILKGFGAEIPPYRRPGQQPESQPQDKGLFAPNIGDFDPTAFLRVINGG